LKHVKLDSPLHIDIFAVTGAKCFGTESSRFDFADAVDEFCELWVVRYLQKISSLNNVGKIKVHDIVAGKNIWVYFQHEVAPSQQKLLFFFKAEYLRANDGSTAFQRKNISNEDVFIPVNFHYVCNLDDRV